MFGALNKDGDEKCLLLWLFDVKGSTEYIRNAARHHQSLCQCPGSQSNTGWCPVTVPPCAVAHAGTWSHSGCAKAPVCAQGWKGGHHPHFRGRKGGHHPRFRCHPSPHTPPNCCHRVAAVVDMVPAQSHFLFTSQRSPPLPGDPGEEGDWMQAPCQDTGLQGEVWDGQAAPSQSCRHLPLLQKDAAFYHHPVRLTGTRINEFLISAPSFSSLPRGYTPTAPWQGGRGGYLQG